MNTSTPTNIQQLSAEQKRALLAQLLREKAAQVVASYPLSYAQQALWFLYQTMPDSAAYNIAFPVRIRSKLNVPAMRKTFQVLIDRHPALRTTFRMDHGAPVQEVHGFQELQFEQVAAAAWTEQELQQQITWAYKQPFRLEQGPLMRVHLFTCAEDDHVLLLVIHHIIHDGWSLMMILLNEFRDLYAAAVTGKSLTLPPIQSSFAQYIERQCELLAGARGEELWAYWQRQLSGELPALNLPTDRPRPPIRTDHGASLTFALPEAVGRQLRQLAQAEGVTPYMLFLAAFQVLLHRYTGQTDILVGTPTTGRDQLEFANVIGYFVNMIVLRANLAENPSFKTFLQQVRQTVIGALAHQDYPFPLLVERLHPERDPSRTPIFQVSYGLRRLQRGQDLAMLMTPHNLGITAKWGELDVEYVDLPQEEGQFDLVLDMVEAQDIFSGIFKYHTDLFEQATITRMQAHFITLLESVLRNPEQRIAELPILSEAERRQILIEWNDTTQVYPGEWCVIPLFEQQVQRTPDAIAAVYGQQQYSYRELNASANQLAHHLIAAGVGPEILVGVCMERSLDALIAILAILKAGGAYVPLDPTYPPDRLAFMLTDAGISVLLTQAAILPLLPPHQAQTICVDRDWPTIAQNPAQNPAQAVTPDTLAYVIYTSGSTGQPKGVMVTQRGICNLCEVQIRAFAVSPQSRVLQFASLSFDASVSEIFVTLLAGATLYLASKDQLLPGPPLRQYLRDNRISVVTLPPSALALLDVADFPDLKTVVSAGEACSAEIIKRWAGTRRFLNAYGPTESTVCTTINEAVSLEHPLSIGKAIANLQTYILDESRQPVPIGVAGELYIGGIGLARGYLNRPELTAEKFVSILDLGFEIADFSKPKSQISNLKSQMLYRTGDLARYLPDGAIEFLGRIDHQVKIRGFRIEIGEIESVLKTHPSIQDCLVMARSDQPGEKRLVAYLVQQPERPLAHPTSELRSFLKRTLPDYMIPAAFVVLDAFPLTPNGKLDRRALPAPEQSRMSSGQPYVAPRTLVEQQLADIWADILKRTPIGVHDNFFELGGDSILSIQMMSRANQAGLHISPNQVFQYQTIAELAAVVSTGAAIQAEQGIVTGAIPLTPIQHWFFAQHFTAPHHWNQALLLTTGHSLNPAILEQTIGHLLRQHDVLRLRFTQKDFDWQQEGVARETAQVFSHIDLSRIPENELSQAIESATTNTQASLNLSDGPLLRVVLFTCGATQPARLLLVIHHLAVDGVSWRILLEDVQTIYQQLTHNEKAQLPPKTTSFKAWAERLTAYSQTDELKAEVNYWTNILSNLKIQPFPRDLSETPVGATAKIVTALSLDATQALLQDIPPVYNTQINDVLLTALFQAFFNWTGQPALLLDVEGHGREPLFDMVDLSRTVGWFTSKFPVVLSPENPMHPGEALKWVKEYLRRIPNHGIGYGLLRYLSPETIRAQFAALPQAEVVFNYLGQMDQALAGTSFFSVAPESPGPLHSPQNRRSYVLEINSFIMDSKLQVEWTYQPQTHGTETIEALSRYFVKALHNLIAHCQSPDAGGYTPSDFPDVELNQAELDRLLAMI